MIIKRIFFFFLLNLAFFNYSFSQDSEKSGIYVMSVDIHTTTWASVSCETFASSFKGMLQSRLINKEDSLNLMDSFLKKIRYKRKNEAVDVRAKINYIKPDNTRISICTNGYDVLINGRSIKYDAKFVAFLKSMILQ